MEYENFDYSLNEDTLTQKLLYANATFNIKDLLSDATSTDLCSISVLTPSQTVSIPFTYYFNAGGHAQIADMVLSRIYPDYIRSNILGHQEVYFKEKENNIFILLTKKFLTVFTPESEKINQKQYNELTNIFEEFKDSDFIKKGEITEVFFNDDIIKITSLNEKMEKLKNKITEKNIPKQYHFTNFDFSGCNSDEDFMSSAKIYAKKLDSLITNYQTILKSGEERL